jgi:uncharacterized SAM-dependent methyltransferase
MSYFKHRDLVEKYHVSLKTVHNWINAAKDGRVELKLHKEGNFTFVADTPENELVLHQLAKSGKKKRNTLHHKTVSPRPEFYSIYSSSQILDIITSLKVHGEIPRQYNYLEDGATNWDNWLQRLSTEASSNILKGTVELIQGNMEAIDRLVEGKKRVNVIDLGAGNALPVKGLLGHLTERKLLNRYIAVDISPAMLNLAKRNVKEWFADSVRFEGYVRDITYERFNDLLVDDIEADDTVNLVLLLGGTLGNFRSTTEALIPIHASMGRDDLLMFTGKPDTEASRRYFDFNPENHRYLLDLMNIDDSLYEVEKGFDAELKMRYIRVRLTTALTVHFDLGGVEREVSFEKGQTILLLRVWHRTALELAAEFEKYGFTQLHSSLTKDRQFIVTISGVEIRNDVA